MSSSRLLPLPRPPCGLSLADIQHRGMAGEPLCGGEANASRAIPVCGWLSMEFAPLDSSEGQSRGEQDKEEKFQLAITIGDSVDRNGQRMDEKERLPGDVNTPHEAGTTECGIGKVRWTLIGRPALLPGRAVACPCIGSAWPHVAAPAQGFQWTPKST